MHLALDTTLGLSLALLPASQKPWVWCTSDQRASQQLMPQVQALLGVGGIRVAQLTSIGVSVGPGSFTGIRLGLALAQAMQLVHPHVRVQGLHTLGMLAQQYLAQHQPNTPFIVALHAAGGQAYTQIFSAHGLPLHHAQVQPITTMASSPHPVYAQADMPWPTHIAPAPAHTFTHVQPQVLAQAHTHPHLHLPPTPFYLKPLTYTLSNNDSVSPAI